VRVVALLVAFVLLLGIGCGGAKTEAPKTEAPKVANLPAGWPAEAFAELTKTEIETYAKVLPNVVAALQKAGFRPVESDPVDIVADMGKTIEAMKPVGGVEATLAAGSVTWDAFRITTYKAMAANGAVSMGFAEAMVKEMTGAEADAAKAEIAKAKAVFDQVPKVNQEMVFTYMDELKPLDEIESKTE
jgi:hypothetical protein